MIPRYLFIILLVFAGAASSMPLAAQELPPESSRRTNAVGTYGGTMIGKTTRVVAGSQIEEELHCSIALRFDRDGRLTAELGEYRRVTTELKRSPAGDHKIITRITGQPGRITVQSSLFRVGDAQHARAQRPLAGRAGARIPRSVCPRRRAS